MRRFEYRGGGSEKFWEIGRDGASVTVRFGRIGTNGQTQVKDLASAAAAEAHVSKLVAEKTRKGYVENAGNGAVGVTTPAVPAPAAPEPAPAAGDEAAATGEPPPPAAPPPPPADEDTWVVPAAWWRQTEPFRGRGPARPAAPDAGAAAVVAELVGLAGPRLGAVLDAPGSDPELARRGRASLGRPAGLLRRSRQEAHPLGAAVVAATLAATTDWQHRDRLTAVVDDWVLGHGIVFAAEAGTLLATVRVRSPQRFMANPHPDMVVSPAGPTDVGTYYYEPLLSRMRALLAAAAEDDYAAAVAAMAPHRGGPLAARIATSYLAPTRQDWLDDDLAAIRAAGLSGPTLGPLLASATTEAQATAVLEVAGVWAAARRASALYSAAAHVGPPVAPVLAAVFGSEVDAEIRKRAVSLLGELPTDEAFGLLLDRVDQRYVQPVVLEAMGRFPHRAMRLLAGAAAGSGARAATARELLRGHAISHPALAAAVRPSLDAGAAQALDAVTAAQSSLPVAGDDELPPILVRPPWAARRARPKPVVVRIEHSSRVTLAWKPGEQEAWASAATDHTWMLGARVDWKDLVDRVLAGRDWRGLAVLSVGPAELARPLLRNYRPARSWNAAAPLRRILGRFGHDAVGLVLDMVMDRPAALAGVLAPFEGSVIALRMAEWYSRSKSIRPVALAWLDRHPEAAARDLVPVAVGPSGKERAMAEAALRALAQGGHREAVRTAARARGPEVEAAVEAALAVDPLELLPARVPALPGWLDPAHLPPVLLAGRRAALPPAAAGHVCTMLAMSKPGDVYAGVEVVRRALDPASLAEMGWSLLERWKGAGFPARDGWVLDALGVIGDDETVRRLAALIRAWPGEGAHKRAVAGLDVLAAIGTDVALMHLHGIAEKARFKGLKATAQAKMDEVADALGLTAEQLADRLVPDFGLEPDGSLVLDYGPRRFRVGFDEQLKPVVSDEDGSRRKLLPKPAAADDPVLAGAAYALFSGLKKDVRTVAADQIRRFEQAMVAGRRWTAAEHRSLFVDHPLLWHLARRLVWATFDEGGRPDGSFRVAEDRTLAGVTDEEVALDGGRVVGIAHPLHLGADLPAWSDLFADYEILQPFPQLGREVFHLTAEERAARVLARFAGLKVATGKVLGLSHRGWERGMAQDAGIQGVTFRRLPGGNAVVVDLDPGIVAGAAMEWPEQTVAGVWLNDGPADWGRAEGNLPFGVLDDTTASEVLRDLEHLGA